MLIILEWPRFKLKTEIDILENEILEKYPNVLNILLRDQTTQKNIIWATNNYKYLGKNYLERNQIKSEYITGQNGNVIMPRVQKDRILQKSRVKNMAEVFTPAWICNAQNNLIDNSWFENKNVFNKEIPNEKKWKTKQEKIKFPKNKTWKDYVNDTRLEIACGEAPYITSRYDHTTGKFIEVKNRIGIIDRKLRIINENIDDSNEWIKFSMLAYKNTYAYELQGDSLLLARESMLFTFIENYKFKFRKEPLLKTIQDIAFIISWNVWQMDGLRSVIPFSCTETKTTSINLFGEEEVKYIKNNGIYCLIMEWSNNELKGKKLRFIDLIEKKSSNG